MGHHLGDNDSYGAAIGLYRAITTMGKKSLCGNGNYEFFSKTFD
mgnify:CR=1 FL=1